MERQVILRDDQEQQAADHNNIQTFVRQTFDDLVFDAIHDGRAYAGLNTTATSSTQVTTAAGQLYANGAMHISMDAVQQNMFPMLPAATKKKVALVTWATENENLDVQSRDYLINVDTGETQPAANPMESRRVANISAVAGVESPDPQLPALASHLLVYAIVTLSTTGIESVEMVNANRLPQLRQVAESQRSIEIWRAATEPRITTIASDITALAQTLVGQTSQRDLFMLFADVARLKEMNELPDDYAAYGADRYLTADETDVGNINLLAKVEEGVRFSEANAGLSELAVFSTLDPNKIISNGLMLPKYTNQTRLNITGYSGEVSISQYGYQTFEITQKSMSRIRIRYGNTYTYCTNSAWWRQGVYDSVTNTFRRNGETFEVVGGDPRVNHKLVRVRQYWADTYEEPYWDYKVTDHTINGAQVGQTFLNSQDGWLTQVGFYLTRRAGSGNINLALCETVNGAPDLTKAIMVTTVNYADLKQYPEQTMVTIPPTFLKAGRRYAVVLTTNANHWAAMASGNSYTQGTFFYSTDGAFYQGDLTKDMMLTLNFAQFANARVVIALQPLQLDGGIANIDINAESIIPGATDLVFEVEINSAWRPLTEVDVTALIGLPPLIPLRAVFLGTSDIMPALKLLGSVVKVWRPRTTFKHISDNCIRVSTTSIKVQLKLEGWNAANHTVACTLLTGVSFATVETADVTETQVIDDYTTIKTYTFNLGAAISNFKIQIDGTTSTALSTYHVAERVDVES